MVTMSRNQQDAAARKRKEEKRRERDEKIARVQRERDIAEVFSIETMFDVLQRETTKQNASHAQIILDGTAIYKAPSEVDGYSSHKSTHHTEDVLGYVLNWKFHTDDLPRDNIYFVNFKNIEDSLPLAGVFFNDFMFDEEYSTLSIPVVVFRKQEQRPVEQILLGLFIYENDEWFFATPDEASSSDIVLGLTLAHEALRAISLTVKANIELVDQPPNPRLSAISEREFGRPLTTYKVLKVNTGHKEYYGRDKDTGLRDFDPRRMHVVRGHHAEYGTNGRGLHFGKYERKIWIPAHVRGNEELGIVVKDYEVASSSD